MKNFIQISQGRGRPLQHVNVLNIESLRKAGTGTVIRMGSARLIRTTESLDEVQRKINEAQW